MADIPQPTSVAELEALIESMYAPGASAVHIQNVNASIVALQTSPEGRQLANHLKKQTYTMVDIPQPTSIAELEGLISSLYTTGVSPTYVQKVNATLQALQTSPQGWQLANELTSSPHEHSHHYAAGTFTVKLNTDWSVSRGTTIPR